MQKASRTNDIPTQIKNPELVDRRRRQIAESAVKLFIKNGFHKTTTRQIAQATGFSIGSLYVYVASKEDVLYLVCDSIHAEVERLVADTMAKAGGGRYRGVGRSGMATSCRPQPYTRRAMAVKMVGGIRGRSIVVLSY